MRLSGVFHLGIHHVDFCTNCSQSIHAQRSTGPKTLEGKAIASRNNFRYGFTGIFSVLPWENQADFDALLTGLRTEHQPSTPTETALVEKMAQSLWLAKRALLLQELTFTLEIPSCMDEKQLALYIRYQTTHDRAFHRCLNDLLKLRTEKRKQEIGFVSQSQKAADQTRREAVENRKQELHRYAVLLAEAKVDHQQMQNFELRSSDTLASYNENRSMEAPKAA
jgi:hypothetical protein